LVYCLERVYTAIILNNSLGLAWIEGLFVNARHSYLWNFVLFSV
jgi:hypothetical protein